MATGPMAFFAGLGTPQVVGLTAVVATAADWFFDK